MLKKALVVLCILISGFIIFIGHQSWVSSQEDLHRASPTTPPSNETSETDTEESDESNPEIEEDVSNFETIISNQPDDVQNMWLEHQENGEPVDITFIVSQSAALTDENWAAILEDELKTTYEEMELNITTIVYEGGSDILVSDLRDGSIDLAEQEIVLYEMATFLDIGVLSIDDQVYYMNRFIEEYQSQYPESYLFVQPPQPLYSANVYPGQVEATQAAVEEFDVPYLNHWAEWPSTDDSELQDYLTANEDANELGHETWATYLVNYFSGN